MQPSSFEELAEQAQESQKPFFVFFYTADCSPCQQMENRSFSQNGLADLVKEHYLAAKVDIRAKNAQSWKAQFGIQTMPTTIFFDKNGNEKKRYEVLLNRQMFRNILYLHLEDNTAIFSPLAEQSTANSAKDSSDQIVKLRLKLDRGDPPAAPAVTAPKQEEKPLYIIRKVPQMEIQVGYFGKRENAEKMATRMRSYFNQPVNIREVPSGRRKMHRVVLGPVAPKEANDLLQKLKEAGYRAFVLPQTAK